MAKLTNDDRIRTWITYVTGIGFLAYFAVVKPDQLSPGWTTLIATCILGKAVLGLWKKSDE